jgi:hypothetical protein
LMPATLQIQCNYLLSNCHHYQQMYHKLLPYQISIRENRKSNQEWTIQRHSQHWAHKTQDEDKQNTTQKIKKMSNTDSTKSHIYELGSILVWSPRLGGKVEVLKIEVDFESPTRCSILSGAKILRTFV